MIRHLRRFAGHLEEHDGVLLGAVVALCLLGTVMVFEAGSFALGTRAASGAPLAFLGRQAVRLALGLAGLYVMARLDYKLLRRRLLSHGLLALSLAALALALALGGIGHYSRWLHLKWLPVQPIELAKVAIVLFLADRLGGRDWRAGLDRELVGVLAVPAAVVALLVLQPNFGSALVIVLLTVAMLYLAGAPWRLLGTLVGPAAGAALLAALTVPKLQARLLAWRDGLLGDGSGYQVEQSLIGLGAGGWHGFGFGQSHQRFWFLPEPHTDFIFSVIGEELGLLGAAATLLLLVLVIWRGYAIAGRAADRFGRLVAGGLTSLVFFYTALNLGMVTGLLPVIGLPLPFVSYGGSALVTNLGAIGILLSIDRRSRAEAAARRRPTV